MKKLFFALLLLPVMCNAQVTTAALIEKTEAGASTMLSMTGSSDINWVEGLSWQQVKEKAKKENKYIFVDCYATWCKPCKQMDKEVYTVDSVSSYLNEQFISLKLQMDVTKNDNEVVRSWRKTARAIESQYGINAYPSYVFFAPNGEVVSIEVGYKDPATFIQVVRNATDPAKQYGFLLKNYKKGKLDDAAKRLLINTAKQLNDTTNYRALRTSYFAYLHKLPKQKLYTKENIEFIASVISRRTHVVFNMFYPNGSAVDKVMEKNGYAKKVVDNVINKEKVAHVLNAAAESKTEPDWNLLQKSIAKEYNNDYATRNVLSAKILWYGAMQPDVLKFARYLNDKMERYGSDTTDLGEDFQLNNAAAMIWEHLGKTPEPGKEIVTEMNRVCRWMEGVARRGKNLTADYVSRQDMYIDTYANLLYKAGRTAEAIKWEEMAIVKLKETVKDEKELKIYLRGYEKCLDKMRKGEPTWPIEQRK